MASDAPKAPGYSPLRQAGCLLYCLLDDCTVGHQLGRTLRAAEVPQCTAARAAPRGVCQESLGILPT